MEAGTAQMTFRAKLKELIDAKGWSVGELARISSIPYATCKSYFQGKNQRGGG